MRYEIVSGNVRTQLGEGPMWSERENALYWVDILGRAVHRRTLADGSICSWSMPEMVGWIIEREHRKGFIAGLASGFVELTLAPFSIASLGNPEPQRPHSRMKMPRSIRRGVSGPAQWPLRRMSQSARCTGSTLTIAGSRWIAGIT